MPNWCSNSLSLSHDNPDMISRAKKAFEEDRFFNEFIPLPEDQEKNWYDWHIEHWGTKWDIAGGSIDLERPTGLEVSFDTAWSPPIAFYKKMEDLGFTVFASYREDGMGYIGEYSNGNDECYEYNFDDDEWRNHLPDRLAEELEGEYEFWKEYQAENEEVE